MIIPRTRLHTASSAPEGRLADLLRVHTERRNIHQAIRVRDAEAAHRAMRQHLSNSRERCAAPMQARTAARRAKVPQ